MKKLLNLIPVLILSFCLAACGSGAEGETSTDLGQYTIRIGHGLSPSSPLHAAFTQMKDYVESKSNGNLTVEIFPSAQVGGEREMVEGVQNGTLEVAYTTTGPFTSFVPEFMVLDIPFQFDSYEEAWMVLDSNVGKELMATAEQYNLHLIAWMESGFRHITTSDVPVTTPDDLKGLKIRTMEAAMHMKNFESMGANPTPVSWSELYLAMSQRMVDGQENPIVNISDLKMYEVQKYLTLSGHLYDAAPLVVNNDWWNSLPAEYRQIISEGAMMASNYNRFMNYLQEDQLLKVLQEHGMEVIELTPEQKEAFRALGQPAVTEAVKNELGAEFVDKWMSDVAALKAAESVSST